MMTQEQLNQMIDEYPAGPAETSGQELRGRSTNNSLKLALVQLLKVRTIITIMVMGVMCYMAITKAIPAEAFMAIASAIITYYFTRKDQKDG